MEIPNSEFRMPGEIRMTKSERASHDGSSGIGRGLTGRALTLPLQILMLLFATTAAHAEGGDHFFPRPEFQSDYKMPTMQVPSAKSTMWDWIDTIALVATMSVGAYVVYRRRSRPAVFILTAFTIAYFGFFRRGCVCPIGSIQNVTASLANGSYALPWVVGAFFAIPLLFTLFFGRIFCGTACPLGAAQDVMLWRPLRVPAWLERAAGLFPFIYLGFAVLLAAVGTDYIICRYDPFIGLYRLSGPSHMLLLGGAFLVASMFVGRIYCRFICPYGAILRLLSPFSKKRVTITPSECVQLPAVRGWLPVRRDSPSHAHAASAAAGEAARPQNPRGGHHRAAAASRHFRHSRLCHRTGRGAA